MLELTDDAGALGKRYTTASGSYYEPLLHVREYDGSARYPLYDGVGTVVVLVDGTATGTDASVHDAFGRYITGWPNPTINPFRFGGAWGYATNTPGSGLVQMGERFYWPEIGRFIQQDPSGDGINWYAYVDNNPLVGIDPEGLDWVIHDFSGEPFLIFTRDAARTSARATLSGMVNGVSFGIVPALRHFGVVSPRFADWTDPCDQYARWSKGWGTVAGGASGAAVAGLGLRTLGVSARWLPNAKGFSIRFSKDFRVEWHRMPTKGKWRVPWARGRNLPHLNWRRIVDGIIVRGIGKHWPWQ